MIRLLAGLEGGFGVRESGARSRFYTRLLSNGIGMSWLDRLWRRIELIDPLLFELPNFITSFQHEAVPVVRDPVIILVSNMLGANRGRVYTISLGYELGTIDRLSVKSFLCRLFMYVFMQGAEHSVLGCSVVRGVVRRARGTYYVKLFFGLNEMYLVERYVYGGRRFEFSPPFAVCHVDRYCILSAGHLFDDQSMRFATDPSNLGDMYSMLSSLPRDLFFFSVDSLLLDGTTGFTTDIHIDPVLPVNYSRIVYLDRGTGIMYRSCNRAIPSTAKYHLECAKRGKAVFIVHRLRLVDPIMYEDYEIVGCRPSLFMRATWDITESGLILLWLLMIGFLLCLLSVCLWRIRFVWFWIRCLWKVVIYDVRTWRFCTNVPMVVNLLWSTYQGFVQCSASRRILFILVSGRSVCPVSFCGMVLASLGTMRSGPSPVVSLIGR
ncbi:p50 [Hibiscus green spot virus 2]|uniref:p50 n=1 Tax=Hibiscus green spot virus 2 TaxID=1513278 RepID=G8DPJ8_9VIRU|nr:p50 [Hibiscus green spot virus 2]AER13446.1 p50 [Hibiscus green spot virus 2]